MMCMRGTPKGMEASLSASFWISFWKAALSPFRNGSMRLFRIFSRTSTLFCSGDSKGPQWRATLESNSSTRPSIQAHITDRTLLLTRDTVCNYIRVRMPSNDSLLTPADRPLHDAECVHGSWAWLARQIS